MRGRMLVVSVVGTLACGGSTPVAGIPDATVVADATADAAWPDAAVDVPGDAVADAGLGMDAGGADGGMDAPATDQPPGTEPDKGPWVLQVDGTRATVRWETLAAPPEVGLDYQPESPDGGTWTHATGATVTQTVTAAYGQGVAAITQPDNAGTFFMDSVRLTGLTPGTCYRYRVTHHEAADGRFCTLHDAMDRSVIRFMALGDTNPILGHTDGIVRNALARNPEFVIHLGDLQYYSSILETWQVWFGMMAPLLRQGGDFQPSIGNHENELNGMEFDNYYARFWDGPGFDGGLRWYHFATGGVHFFSLSTEDDFSMGALQLAWFTGALAAAEASPGYRFSVVYFHRPLYTVGDTDPQVGLRTSLGALFATHHIPLVMAGHMHGYERFEVGPVTYVTSGGGGGVIGNVNANVTRYPADAMLRVASGPYYHALVVTIDGTTLRGEAVDEHGVVQDTFTRAVP